MRKVRYDMPEALKSLEFILEQVIYGTEVIIARDGVEIARVTAVEGLTKRRSVSLEATHEHQ
ncbi:hypothetical protein [Pseudomonas bharatica]|uniref:hypothetical protein n=1 Tax=Pseudomonas TaxID=286 RepID=UPI003B27BAF2